MKTKQTPLEIVAGTSRSYAIDYDLNGGTYIIASVGSDPESLQRLEDTVRILNTHAETERILSENAILRQRIVDAEAERNKALGLDEHHLTPFSQLASELASCRKWNTDLLAALKALVDFCDDPEGSTKPESLAVGLARLLPAARTALGRAAEPHADETFNTLEDGTVLDLDGQRFYRTEDTSLGAVAERAVISKYPVVLAVLKETISALERLTSREVAFAIGSEDDADKSVLHCAWRQADAALAAARAALEKAGRGVEGGGECA